MDHNLNLPPRPPPPPLRPPPPRPQIPLHIKPILSPVSKNYTISFKKSILPNSTTTTTTKIIPNVIPGLLNLSPPKPNI